MKFIVSLSNSAALAVIAPAEGVPVADPDGGWAYINSSEVSSNNINWYFHTQDASSTKTLAEYSGFYTKVELISVGSLPFFNLYTKPKGDGTDAGGWYGSRRTYTFPASPSLSAGDTVLMYIGDDLPATFVDIPHIQLQFAPGASNGSDDSTQELLQIGLGTSSAAAPNAVNLVVTNFIYSDGKHTNIVVTG
jgi:hypothetical protein